MTAEQTPIGEKAFYKMVGGPDAMIPRDAGASVILRLLAIQIRDACRVKPNGLDQKTNSIIKSVDAFYNVKSKRRFPKTATTDQEAHPASQIFEISGLPQDMLLHTREDLDKRLQPLKAKGGFVAKLVERVVREYSAARLSRTIVGTKTDIIFGFGVHATQHIVE